MSSATEMNISGQRTNLLCTCTVLLSAATCSSLKLQSVPAKSDTMLVRTYISCYAICIFTENVFFNKTAGHGFFDVS